MGLRKHSSNREKVISHHPAENPIYNPEYLKRWILRVPSIAFQTRLFTYIFLKETVHTMHTVEEMVLLIFSLVSL